MNLSKQQAYLVFVAVAGLVGGLTVVLLWGPNLLIGLKVVGAVLIANGFFLLTSQNLIRRDQDIPAEVQVHARRLLLRRLRVMGASSMLMGAALLVPDERIRVGLMGCAAVVNVAMAFKVPRRLFREGSVS